MIIPLQITEGVGVGDVDVTADAAPIAHHRAIPVIPVAVIRRDAEGADIIDEEGITRKNLTGKSSK